MPNSIFEAVFENSKKYPEKLCVADAKTAFSYREYLSLVLKISAFLSSSGFEKGDAAVFEASQSVYYLASQLAVQAVGGIFVPLEKNCGAAKISAVSEKVGAKLVVTSADVSGAVSLQALVEKASELEERKTEELPKGDEVCEILFSTGTTGKEKGIMITNKNNVALAENVVNGVEMKKDNVELIPSPLNHSHALRRYYGNMLSGASVVLCSGVINLKEFFGLIQKFGVNSIDLVPTALSIVLKLSGEKLGEYRESLRYIELGSAPLMKADKEKLKSLLPKTRLYNFYGSTESGCIAIYNFNRENDKENCIGRPTVNAKIFAVDEERKAVETSENQTGLLACFGKMNMKGYWQDEEETAAALENGTIYTNDEIYFDKDGDIILLGRRGDVINIGGNKVSPEEIENVAKGIEGVADCACVAVTEALRGSVPKLFVEMKPGAEFDISKLKAEFSKSVEAYKIPKYFVRVEKIPRTFNGKVIRRLLK